MATNDMTGGTAASGGHLGRLNDLDEFKVADGYPDPRGWDVKTTDGQTVGKVDDLIVDTQAMRVRYVSVEVDRSLGQMARDAATPGDQGTHTLIPVGSVELDDRHDDVLVNGYTLQQVAGLPRYSGAITREYESSVVRGHRDRGASAAGGVTGAVAAAGAAVAAGAEKVKDAVTGDRHSYEHDDYDDQRLYARRRGATAGAAGEQRLTLAEEQLAVGKRQTSAGEVEVRKAVDTERVREQVQLQREEAVVERRPITDPSQVSDADNRIGEEQIRVPLMAEQAVVQKTVVPREEIIVRKNAVTENQTVQDTVRRERLVVDDSTVQDAASVKTTGTNAKSTDRR